MDQNISDALKMAAAILFFAGALSLAIISMSDTRNGAIGVIESYSDTVEFYDVALFNQHSTDALSSFVNKYASQSYSVANPPKVNFQIESERVVGMETILSNVFEYYDTGYTILFYYWDGAAAENESVKPLPLYCTQAILSDLYYSKLRIIDGEDGIEVEATDGVVTDVHLRRCSY